MFKKSTTLILGHRLHWCNIVFIFASTFPISQICVAMKVSIVMKPHTDMTAVIKKGRVPIFTIRLALPQNNSHNHAYMRRKHKFFKEPSVFSLESTLFRFEVLHPDALKKIKITNTKEPDMNMIDCLERGIIFVQITLWRKKINSPWIHVRALSVKCCTSLSSN